MKQKFACSSSKMSQKCNKKPQIALDDAQTLHIKTILVECLQNLDQKTERQPPGEDVCKLTITDSTGIAACSNDLSGVMTSLNVGPVLTKASLLRSYLSGSNPHREEYISKRKNVSNSLISSDSVHHSIFLKSGRERRQCLLQYLTCVATEGQVVIYANSIPGVESLLDFLTKHGFRAEAIHPRMLMAESNWILSEFAMKHFSVLLCAEDHYHSFPVHFRGVKTIINYELPLSNPLENWATRNGIVEFSNNLPVHIYTFIKKSCPVDSELVKILHLNVYEDQEELL